MRMLFVCGYEVTNKQLKTASWIQSIIHYLDSEHEISLVGESCYKTNNKITVKNGQKEIQCYKFWRKIFGDGLKSVLKEIRPDVVIIFGTESDVSIEALNICIEENIDNHTAVFAQGFCSICARHYADGLPRNLINRYTFRDIVRHDRIKEQIKSFEQRAVAERDILSKTKHFIGRTTIDKAILRSVNQAARYYKCNDVLRDSFYQGEWDYNKCQKHRVFVSQYYYPIKGFHILLEAVSLLVKRFPDIKLAVAGYNPIKKDFSKKELKDSSYIRYLKALASKYKLENNILLLGELNQEEMKEQYLAANMFALTSVIENSPNSLAEAMALGVPTVAADVGGVTDFVKHKEEAYVYPSTEPYLLANYITEVFENVDKTIEMGKALRKRAAIEFDRNKNIDEFENICKKIAAE